MHNKTNYHNKIVGSIGEKLAVKYLKKNRYKILKTNFKTCYGEIDIVAEKDNTLSFVEVKTRTTTTFGEPFFAVTEHKKTKLIRSAYVYLYKYFKQDSSAQIDIISINLTGSLKFMKLEHMKNTVWLDPF